MECLGAEFIQQTAVSASSVLVLTRDVASAFIVEFDDTIVDLYVCFILCHQSIIVLSVPISRPILINTLRSLVPTAVSCGAQHSAVVSSSGHIALWYNEPTSEVPASSFFVFVKGNKLRRAARIVFTN